MGQHNECTLSQIGARHDMALDVARMENSNNQPAVRFSWRMKEMLAMSATVQNRRNKRAESRDVTCDVTRHVISV